MRYTADAGDRTGEFLGALEARLRAEVDRGVATRPARPLIEAGGKRLRARLLWHAAASVCWPLPPPVESLVDVAVALELGHLGSLIHDDIVDRAATRRGIPTLHRSHGVPHAIETGAALLHLASARLAPLPHPLRRAAAHAVGATCRGQLRELLLLGASDVDPTTRLGIMEDKTGALFQLAALLGAAMGSREAGAQRRLQKFGRCFGIAFQIADDVLDLVGHPARLGRANGADLLDGVMTLPVILAIRARADISAALQRVRDGGVAALAECITRIEATGALEGARAECRRWLARAEEALAEVPPSPPRSALAALAQRSVSDVFVDRRHVRRYAPPTRRRFPPVRLIAPDRDSRASVPPDPTDRRIARHLMEIDQTLAPLAPSLGCPTERRACRAIAAEAERAGTLQAHERAAIRAFVRAMQVRANTDGEALVTSLAASDCWHAVSLRCLAEAGSASHARVAALFTALLTHPERVPSGRSPAVSATSRFTASIGCREPHVVAP